MDFFFLKFIEFLFYINILSHSILKLRAWINFYLSIKIRIEFLEFCIFLRCRIRKKGFKTHLSKNKARSAFMIIAQ